MDLLRFLSSKKCCQNSICFPCENGANPRTHRGCFLPAVGGYPQENGAFFLLPLESSICTSCQGKINFVAHTLCSPPRCHFVAIRRTSRPTLRDTGMQHLEAPDNSDRCPCNQLLSSDQGEHGTKCQIDPSANASASPRCFSACARKTGRPVHAKQGAASTPS